MDLRPVDPGRDLAELERLFSVVADHDDHFPIGEHKYLDLLAGTPSSAGVVGTIGGRLIAYLAVTEPRAGTAALEIAVHPDHRTPKITHRLVEHGVAAARAEGAGALRVWTFHPQMVEELEAAAFRPERELHQVRVRLPIPLATDVPPGVVLRPFRTGSDEDAWLAVNNAAFAGHPENGAWTREILQDRMAQPWFEPSGFVMAWEAGTLLGSCWTKPHSDLGEIYVVAVSPAVQRRGLGRLLVERGLDVIHHRYGFGAGMLYVDADNAVARRLYDTMGFRLHHVDRSLVLTL